ncbi:hypothetical protein ABIQ69_15395 [Agromyces sp. G08B096]|uniref:DUF998 domain-containing protein n=1 Tax=Agromyces sp. G08B096 TaxID=3156399 RepID=A0AAU7W8F0_9MICO
MHVLLIVLAFAIVIFRLGEGRPVGSSSAGAVLDVWMLPAVAGGAVIGAALLVASASPKTLALLGRVGLPSVQVRHRAQANGLVWAAIGLLAVHFTAPAFEPLPGGALLAALVLGLGLGTGTAHLHAAAVSHEAYRTFNLVAMLLASGALASMSLTPTGSWWTLNFSTLGTSDDIAAACFNVAIVVSGLAMALLGPALTRALRAPRFGLRRGGLTTIRVLIAVIGASLMGVGLVPIDGATDLHNLFACGAAAGFAVLSIGVRGYARRMPRTLVVFSYAAITVEVAAMVAYDRLGLFNLTVFEIVAFSLVFAWLIALVATTSAAAADERSPARRRFVARRRRKPEVAAARTRPPARSGGSTPLHRGRPRRRTPRVRGALPRRLVAAHPEEPPDARLRESRGV